MKLPGMNVISRKRDMINEFLGIDERTVISDGFFNTQKNVSMDKYPTMSRREGFDNLGTTDINISGTKTTTNVHGAVVMDDYVYMVLERSLYKFHKTDFPLECLSEEDISGRLIHSGLDYSTKQMVKMGAYIVILPDKVVVNTEEDSVININRECRSGIKDAINMDIKLLNSDYEEIEGAIYGDNEPLLGSEYRKDGQVWLDTRNDSFEAKKYSAATSSWFPITVYWCYTNIEFSKKFEKGESVYIGGYDYETDIIEGEKLTNNATIIEKVEKDTGRIIWKATSIDPGDGIGCPFPYFSGFETSIAYYIGGLVIKSTSPEMDYVCSYANRLWGCSSENHEIYASAQGNPFSWYQYQGITSDSYAATVGSEGDFTGCIAYLDNVLFFKEDRIIKVYGTKPANYQISEIVCRGVKKGCSDSLVIADEILYYNSREGILAYDGSFPSSISERLELFNTEHINLAIALNKKVYFFDRYGNINYVYDVKRGLWTSYTLPYEETNAVNKMDLFELEDEIYLCSTFEGMTGTHVYKMNAGECEEDTNEWKAVTGILGLDNPDNKYISMINIRINLIEGSTFVVGMQYDEGEIKEACRVTAETTKTFTIPIIPQRCDTFRMHLGGTGKFTLYSITKYTETGSDVGSDV